MTNIIGRRALGGFALGALAAPQVARAQSRELVIVSFAGQLQEPHQWLARRMEARHPGLRIRLVPSEAVPTHPPGHPTARGSRTSRRRARPVPTRAPTPRRAL